MLVEEQCTCAQELKKSRGLGLGNFRPGFGRFCRPSLQLMQLILWSCRDLYRIATFLSEEGYKADITDCRQRFPGLLTFCEFLELSHWADATRTYADGFDY